MSSTNLKIGKRERSSSPAPDKRACQEPEQESTVDDAPGPIAEEVVILPAHLAVKPGAMETVWAQRLADDSYLSLLPMDIIRYYLDRRYLCTGHQAGSMKPSFSGQEDPTRCIDPGAEAGYPKSLRIVRGLSIDYDGHVWSIAQVENALLCFDSDTGKLIRALGGPAWDEACRIPAEKRVDLQVSLLNPVKCQCVLGDLIYVLDSDYGDPCVKIYNAKNGTLESKIPAPNLYSLDPSVTDRHTGLASMAVSCDGKTIAVCDDNGRRIDWLDVGSSPHSSLGKTFIAGPLSVNFMRFNHEGDLYILDSRQPPSISIVPCVGKYNSTIRMVKLYFPTSIMGNFELTDQCKRLVTLQGDIVFVFDTDSGRICDMSTMGPLKRVSRNGIFYTKVSLHGVPLKLPDTPGAPNIRWPDSFRGECNEIAVDREGRLILSVSGSSYIRTFK